MAVAVVGAVIVGLVLLAVTRRVAVAAVGGTAIVAAFMRTDALLLPTAGAVALLLAFQQWRRMRGRSTFRLTPAHAVVPAVGLLVVTIATAFVDGAVTFDELLPVGGPSAAAAGGSVQPNVYVLLLDGYPRADELARNFGYDNSGFIGALEDLGFDVAGNATARFRRTEFTLASTMLSDPSPVDAYAATPRTSAAMTASRRAVRREYLRDEPTMDALRSAGYQLIYVPSQVGHVEWRGWDVTLDTGQLTSFEVYLLQRSALSSFVDGWIVDQQRDRIETSLAAWSGTADRPGQHLTFGHVMSPHPPFLYGPEAGLPDCWYRLGCTMFEVRLVDVDMSLEDYGRRFGEQLDGLNPLTLDAVERVIDSDPSAVVILMSDHGARFSQGVEDEHFHSFFATRLPGDLRLAGDPGPDGLFVRLLDMVGD